MSNKYQDEEKHIPRPKGFRKLNDRSCDDCKFLDVHLNYDTFCNFNKAKPFEIYPSDIFICDEFKPK